ncbi:MAG: major facilitator superfamily transporter [Frankiales bacterium]|nr:major facilitator superfamily transporter [Frankiales bacterium]
MAIEAGLRAPRTTVQLLVDPAFGGLFWGKICSVVGVWIHSVVAAVLTYDVTHSAAAVGLVGVAQYGPQLAFAPLSGALTDRGYVRSQLITGRLLCTIGSGALAVWLIVFGADSGWTTAWAVLVASLVVGLGFVAGGPAQQSVVPQLVEPEELPTAMVLNTAPNVLGRNGGPILGALVLAAWGSAAAFAVAAVTHLVFTAILTVIKLPKQARLTRRPEHSFTHALRHVVRDRPLLLLLIAGTASAVGSEPTITLMPAIADQLHGSDHIFTILSIAFGGGSTVAFASTAVVARRTSQSLVVAAGLVLLTAGSLLATVTVSLVTDSVAFAAVGWGFGWTMTATTTLIQQRTPHHLRGRVMAMWLIGFVGGRPLASALVGSLADVGSVALAFGVLTILMGAVVFACRPGRVGAVPEQATLP